MGNKTGRYSKFLRPALIIYDLVVLNFFALHFLDFNNKNLFIFSSDLLNNKHFLYIFYSTFFWITSTFFLKFYFVYRFTSALNVILLLVKQFIFFTIIVFAFIGVFRSINIEALIILTYLMYSFVAIGFMKLLSYYLLKIYRVYLNGNLRNVVVVGSGGNVEELKNVFIKDKKLGYRLNASFSNSKKGNCTGTIADSFMFLETVKHIDEIYCAIDELTDKEVNKYIQYANTHKCHLKFIPKTKKVFTKRLKTDYYGYLPVLTIQEVALNNELNKFIKRSFDILFSFFIIVFILSWLSIILFIIIKLESKGPLFYKHKRNGINYKEFECYKYRSLTTTKEIRGTYVKPNDDRLTKIGRFLRKSNLDELPQFINVLIGDMSVVGPRPHMLSYTDEYSKKIDKYNFIFRHHVKPGITGLAQTKGYRGEVKKDKDIINRVKLDIFYIENWSLLLDLKIIAQTIINVLKGEEKAY